MLMINWRNIILSEDDKKHLSAVTRKLMHINSVGKSLMRHLISDADWQDRDDVVGVFQPNEKYKIGEAIFFRDGKIGKIQKVEDGYNPLHGSFQIISVSFGSNSACFASEVEGATPLDYKDYKNLSEDELDHEVDEIFDEYGESIRQVILEGIENGSLDILRFRSESQLLNRNGLRKIDDSDLMKIKECLEGCVRDGELACKSTAELLKYAFDDGASGEERDVRIFSLNYVMDQYEEFHYLGDNRWMLSKEVPRISVQKRPSVPRIRSKMAEQIGIDDTIDYDDVEHEEDDRRALEEQNTVLDPFAGTGSTLVAAYYGGKTGIGFEISSEFIETIQNRFKQKLLFIPDNGTYHIYNADARDMMNYVEPESVDICITSPPYWDILNQKRSADKKPVRNYGNLENDLGTTSDYDQFIDSIAEVFSLVYRTLKPKMYCIINVMDLRKKSVFYPFHIDVINFMTKIGYILDDIIIWDRRQEYNNLRPLGYPSVFRINRVHEYLLIFQK